jgi:peptidyl-prolyl cis-trans isomerase C
MTSSKIKALLKEPLLHFFLLGGLIFVLNALFGNSKYIPENNEILVTNSLINSRVNQFAMQMGRPASKEEVIGFIDKYIHEEVLSREAKLLGLDNDDIVIRRRLVQKMEFMSGEFSVVSEPTLAQLEAYFEKNSEAYKKPAAISFYQVFINSQDLSEQELNSKADAVMRDLGQIENTPDLSSNYGDRTMLSNQFTRVTYDKLFQSFGDEIFVEEIQKAPEQEWSGPLKSAYGHHLVFITEKTESAIPVFSEVAVEVNQDFLDFKKRKANEEFFAQMQERYIINMDAELSLLYDEQ